MTNESFKGQNTSAEETLRQRSVGQRQMLFLPFLSLKIL